MTEKEATVAVIQAARRVLEEFEVEWAAGHGVGGARMARIRLAHSLMELDAASQDYPSCA